MTSSRTIAAISSASWLRAFVVVVCLAIVLLQGWRDWTEQQHEILRVQNTMATLAHSMVRHAEDTFEIADAVVVDLVDRASTAEWTPARLIRLREFLTQRIKTLPRLESLAIYAKDGRLLTSSMAREPKNIDAKAEPFFDHHGANSDPGWFFSPLVRNPLDGKAALALSRRFEDPNGGFGGVVVANVQPSYFSDYYSSFDMGRKGTIALFTASGLLVARFPVVELAVGANASEEPLFTEYLPRSPAGTYGYRSDLDATERLGGYSKGQTFPLVVLAASGKDEAMAAWNRIFLYRGMGVAVLVGIIAALGWSLTQQLRRRDRAEAELSILAATDGLTGLANRRTFDSHLESEWLRAAREATALSLLLVDIDCFKAFNDAYGHQAGDLCLQAVAKVLEGSVRRPADLVARYGGEEVAVLLPRTDPEGASRIAEKIRQAVENMAMPHTHCTPAGVVTISIGAATLYPALKPLTVAPKDLVALADRALYEAKLNGRNRVSVSKAACTVES